MSWTARFTDPALSKRYKTCRPTYPDALYEQILEYLAESELTCAVDVGCGSGQSTEKLATYFSRVIGIDISQTQLEVARANCQLSHLEYMYGSCNSMNVSTGSVDLVTSAMSAHWFHPIEDFYSEADRVLRPGGVLALYGYGIPKVGCREYDGDVLTDALWQLIYRDERLSSYMTGTEKEVAENFYRSFNLPYPGWKRYDHLSIHQETTFSGIVGFASSLSFVSRYLADNPGNNQLVDSFVSRYQDIIGIENMEKTVFNLEFPVFLLVGQKPLE